MLIYLMDISPTANTASTIALRDGNGNLNANFFVGNGSQLTGIIASAGAAITNGNSNVTVTANSNVTISVTVYL
jgi:UDP:flavonoid glycosyltransferase YjiC (YdhE family)